MTSGSPTVIVHYKCSVKTSGACFCRNRSLGFDSHSRPCLHGRLSLRTLDDIFERLWPFYSFMLMLILIFRYLDMLVPSLGSKGKSPERALDKRGIFQIAALLQGYDKDPKTLDMICPEWRGCLQARIVLLLNVLAEIQPLYILLWRT